MKHKQEDLKLAAVRYFIRSNTSYVKTCELFDVSERSLKRWIERYQATGAVKRRNRTPVSYKISKTHTKFILDELRKNEQITMEKLKSLLVKKFHKLKITSQHIGRVIRAHNLTRKRTRREHFPAMRYGKEVDQQAELDAFYRKIDQYDVDKILCLDETSISLGLIPDYSRCKLGKRCVVKSDDNRVFKKYTLLAAISSKGLVGYTLYEQGGMTSERFCEFIRTHINGKYKTHLVVVDNAGAHKKQEVRQIVQDGDNELLYTIPYTPRTNAIENWFSQLKHHLKADGVLSFSDLKRVLRVAMARISPENYRNYFLFAYRKQELRKRRRQKSTRSVSPKTYKLK